MDAQPVQRVKVLCGFFTLVDVIHDLMPRLEACVMTL